MSLALYPSRVRSSDLLGAQATGMNVSHPRCIRRHECRHRILQCGRRNAARLNPFRHLYSTAGARRRRPTEVWDRSKAAASSAASGVLRFARRPVCLPNQRLRNACGFTTPSAEAQAWKAARRVSTTAPSRLALADAAGTLRCSGRLPRRARQPDVGKSDEARSDA